METSLLVRKNRKLVLWLLLAALLICCCGAAGAGLLTNIRRGPGWNGLNGEVCAGYLTTPRFQVGVAWASPISSYLPPLMTSTNTLCLDVPSGLVAAWPSLAGQWVLPP